MSLRSDWDQLDGDQFLRKYAPIAEFAFIFLLIVLHLILPNYINITWQLIALILMLVVIPYIPLIKRISYGELEAELETLVQSAEENVESADVSKSNTNAAKRAAEVEKVLKSQLETDPKIALAKLRIELEDLLSGLASQKGFDQEGERYAVRSFRKNLEFLRENSEMIDQDLYDDIMRVREVANKAIHSGEVDRDTARRIIQIGLRVLERLYYEVDSNLNIDQSQSAFPQATKDQSVESETSKTER